MTIGDDDAEKAVNYIRDHAEAAAKAKAERIYMEEYRKVVRSQIMREHDDKPLGAQEAIAQADPRYKLHLEAMKTAIEADEYQRWMMTAAEAKVSAWQTMSRNARV